MKKKYEEINLQIKENERLIDALQGELILVKTENNLFQERIVQMGLKPNSRSVKLNRAINLQKMVCGIESAVDCSNKVKYNNSIVEARELIQSNNAMSIYADSHRRDMADFIGRLKDDIDVTDTILPGAPFEIVAASALRRVRSRTSRVLIGR